MTSVAAGASIALQLLQPGNMAAGSQPVGAVEIVAQSESNKQKNETPRSGQGTVAPILTASQSPGTKDAAGKINTAILDAGAQANGAGSAASTDETTALDERIAFLKARLAGLQSDKEGNKVAIAGAEKLLGMVETKKKLMDVVPNIKEMAKKIEENYKEYLAMTPEEKYEFDLDMQKRYLAGLEERLQSDPNGPLAAKYAEDIKYAKISLQAALKQPEIAVAIQSGALKPTAEFDRTTPGVQTGYVLPTPSDFEGAARQEDK